MENHLFFICDGEPQFSQTWFAVRNIGVFRAMAAGTIVVCICRQEPETLLARLRVAGLPEGVAAYDGAVPPEAIAALPDEYVRKNVKRLADMYGPTVLDAEPLLQKRGFRRPPPAKPSSPDLDPADATLMND